MVQDRGARLPDLNNPASEQALGSTDRMARLSLF
jgi:hypothetical protein